jgi:hypothetical protein
MRYTVLWKPSALQRLTEIWLAASDRDEVNRAVSDIEHHLAHQASAGAPYLVGTKIIVAPPLAVVYEVDHGDCKATIVRIAYQS